LPGIFAGYRNTDGSFNLRGNTACIWSSSQYDSSTAWLLNLNFSYATVYRLTFSKATGFSAILERKGQSNETK
jgi:hypothetical protein